MKLGFMATIPRALHFIDLIDEQLCSVDLHEVCLFLPAQHLMSEKKRYLISLQHS